VAAHGGRASRVPYLAASQVQGVQGGSVSAGGSGVEALETASSLVYEAPSLTWQAAVGAVAGVFPFIIASIDSGNGL